MLVDDRAISGALPRGFVTVLRRMATVVLILGGCSQPSRRGSSVPAPKDADVKARVDAMTENAPVDASASVDAREHRVMWQYLRDRPSKFNPNAAAIVVNVRAVSSSETFIVLDVGTRDSVEGGWKGRLLDSEDRRVFDIFEVTKTDTHRSEARVRANVDQVNPTSMHAVLWDPSDAEP